MTLSFRCQYDKPSQRDHDKCLNTTYEENIELFLKTAMSRADQTHVMKLWYEGLKNIDPPVSAMEMLKYNCPDWLDEHLQSDLAIEKLKSILLLL